MGEYKHNLGMEVLGHQVQVHSLPCLGRALRLVKSSNSAWVKDELREYMDRLHYPTVWYMVLANCQ